MLVGFRRMGTGCGELARGPCWPDRANVLPGRAVRSQNPQSPQGSNQRQGYLLYHKLPKIWRNQQKLLGAKRKASETRLYLEPLGTLSLLELGVQERSQGMSRAPSDITVQPLSTFLGGL